MCEASFGGPTRSEIEENHYPEMTMYLGGTPLPGTTIEKEPDATNDFYIFTQVISKTENDDMCRIIYAIVLKHQYLKSLHAFNAHAGRSIIFMTFI